MTEYKKCDITRYSDNDRKFNIYVCHAHKRNTAWRIDLDDSDVCNFLDCPREAVEIKSATHEDYNALLAVEGENPMDFDKIMSDINTKSGTN